MTDTTQELITTRAPAINDLVSAIVDANCNVALAVERLRRKGVTIDAADFISQLAADPTADEMISKQLRMKAKLLTYQMFTLYQAKLIADVDDDERPLTQQGAVQGFTAISSLFNSLTDQRGAQPFTGNILDRIFSVVPPEVREAIATLAAVEPTLPAPTPIRKRPGRPPHSEILNADEVSGT